MDLQEKIARLIDPNVWHYADLIRNDTPISARVLTEPSLAAARRVIDGLGLREREAVVMTQGHTPYIGRNIVSDLPVEKVRDWGPGDAAQFIAANGLGWPEVNRLAGLDPEEDE